MRADLGARLRAAREAKGLSLRKVAVELGVSPSLLSQVETGKTQPSVSTLYALVNHLGASLDDLLGTAAMLGSGDPECDDRPEDLPSDDVVQRAADNPIIDMENGVRWERLAVGPGNLVDPLVVTYRPGGSSSVDGHLMRHSGIEYGYLLEGELILQLDFDRHTIRAGDSFCFDSIRPHLYSNESGAPARGLWFVVGRRDFTPPDAADSASPEAVVRGGIGNAIDVLNALQGMNRGASAAELD
ncbi:helix-turn-helix domain-containing protein [Schumannella sp. 10F1B-5-1]|nr:helix-turn-helix domain-containing protein [Schumannella sp. 10F1B-5-1]